MKKYYTLLTLLPVIGFAAPIKNDIGGVGPNNSVKPYLCIQNANGTVTLPLAPGQSGDGNKASGNDYFAGGTIRFNGCNSTDSYLGYAGFNLSAAGNNAVSSYTPPEGVHITIERLAISSVGDVTGAVKYTPIEPNYDLTQAKAVNSWQFAGINLSGLEFGKVIDPVVIPNLSAADSATPYTDLNDTNSFINMGINTVRLPISWGFIQLDGAGVGTLNDDYYMSYIRPQLQSLTHAKINTIIDLHAYMRYSEFGKQYSGCFPGAAACPDGTLITDPKAFESVWGQIADKVLNDSTIDKQFIMFDLMNEPVGVPDDKVFTIQASLIKMLRDKKFDGYILVEGNSWTGLHSWTNYSWTSSDGQSYTNATLFTRANFEKAGIDLSKILINVHQYLDSDYSGNGNECLQDLSTTGPNGFNLNAFVNYLQDNRLQAIVTEFGTGLNASSCQQPLQQFFQYLQDNSSKGKDYGFAGWTLWSTGHGWGNYNLRITPTSYQATTMSEFLK